MRFNKIWNLFFKRSFFHDFSYVKGYYDQMTCRDRSENSLKGTLTRKRNQLLQPLVFISRQKAFFMHPSGKGCNIFNHLMLLTYMRHVPILQHGNKWLA